MLKHFIHGKNGQLWGTLVALKTDQNEFGIGWAACRTEDMPTKEMGLRIAQGRAMTPNYFMDEIFRMPDHLVEPYLSMIARSRRYFQNCDLLQEQTADTNDDAELSRF